MSIIATVGASLMGSSIFYSRKLYKVALTLGHEEPTHLFEKLNEMGYYFFYLLRPLYAVSFALLALVIMKMFYGISNDQGMTSGFVYLMILISFMIGYFSSKLINLFERDSKEEAQDLPTSEIQNS